MTKEGQEQECNTIGIDLGAWKSCVALQFGQQVRIVPNMEGNRISPSYLAITDYGNMIGDEARTYQDRPNSFISHVKKYLGRKYEDATLQHLKKEALF